MFPETYTKFFAFISLALLLGFAAMEFVTSGIPAGRISGMATSRAADAGPGLTADASPGANLVFLFVGIFAGMVLLASGMYIYNAEKRQH